jgi:hypothetical protein
MTETVAGRLDGLAEEAAARGGLGENAFALDRLRGEGEARTGVDRIRYGVARAGEELREKAWTLGRDRRAEARKQRAWKALQTAAAAGFSLLARRAAAGVYEALTGEQPGL